ncbi:MULTISPECIES: TadE/TadG family type IV pilus assembly protein [Pseudomonas]|jgi:Flp pilus assembly protein TadG|uniref:TadE/TadG family type IV pilus assembly protein n=1 Tax=Pseudomonas TaxID=286 RepID=UPI000876DFEB|nr:MULTISPECIES: TadE/TadG family type IV pilus assembly protein [Pseudomonas]MBP3997528.1 pilus assembly protein [Pseudomonas koreensis]POA30274.1 pilus assembly protein [Pseudomonas sp. GW456-12-1-14-TSB6]SCZ32676.1 Flp pilus assembly protein TadG [Pseudomonas sp. NFIX46]SDB35113.1 Flp pilus assembly protein TadG [Pseudomonas putida]SFQ88173.1 Flp pilus assembly protein TadG [Pseudomonas sp. NFIX49]
MKTGSRKAQKGAVAIEFALVFVIFFAVFYGLVSYSLPFVLMQTFNQVTAEAIRRAVAVDPAVPNYASVLVSTANAALTQQLSVLPSSLNVVVGTDTSTVYDPAQGTLTVSVNYPVSKLNQVIPFLVLPGVGAVPSLPANLTAISSLKF